MAIIGLISGIILLRLNDVREQARDAKRLEALHQLQLALELYYNDNGEYPFWTGSGSDEGVCLEEGDGKIQLASALVGKGYLKVLPEDLRYKSADCGFDGETTYPGRSGCFCLTYKTSQDKEYKVFARMEQENEAAQDDGGVYSTLYEVYSPAPGSNEISYPQAPCEPNWQCGSWSECLNSQQTRTCTDVNSCTATSTLASKPAESQSCNVATPTTSCGSACTSECGADANCTGWPSVISNGPGYNQFACDANKNRTDSVSYSYCICNENCQTTFIEEYSGCSNGFVDRGDGMGTCLIQCGSDSACNFGMSGGQSYRCNANKERDDSGAYYCICDVNCKTHSREEYGCQNGASIQLGPDVLNYELLSRPVCLTQCGASSFCHGSDPGGSSYKCNADGTANGSGAYYCFCGDDCQLSISSNITYSCEDSDGGMNYSVKGWTQWKTHYPDGLVQTSVYEDTCSGASLDEWQCSGTDAVKSVYTCPNGCSTGACLEGTPTSGICSGCSMRPASSGFKCNLDGTYNANAQYFCTCLENYATDCTIKNNGICEANETDYCETVDCGTAEQKASCVTPCSTKVCTWDFTYRCNADKSANGFGNYLCSCYSGENCRATVCGNGVCENVSGNYASESEANCFRDCGTPTPGAQNCSECLFRSANSQYRCNSNGTYNGTGPYLCTCLKNNGAECTIANY